MLTTLGPLQVETSAVPVQQPQKKRIEWIDVLKGLTVSLVVLHHITLSLHAIRALVPSPIFVNEIDWLFQNFRMASFFLCSGVVFAGVAKRGWTWFFRDRLMFFVWIILLWSGIGVLFDAVGINIYPWAPLATTDDVYRYAYTPKGALWFIFAIMILSAFSVLTRNLPKLAQLGLSLGCAFLAYLLLNEFGATEYSVLIESLYRYGFPMFAIGVLFKPQIMALLSSGRKVGAVIVACLVAAVILHYVSNHIDVPVLVARTIPMTIAFVGMVSLACRMRWFAKMFAALGRRSLEIFLLHLFFIGVVYHSLLYYRAVPPWYVLWLPLCVLTVGASLFASKVMSRVPGNLFFRQPQWASLKTSGSSSG